MAIKDWPALERPREKLLNRGASHLSDAELLSIFVQCGIKGKNAVELARDTLERSGGLGPLLEANFKQFCCHPGLGKVRFVLLQAALEIARRYLEHEMKSQKVVLTSSALTKQFVSASLKQCHNEVFGCLFLDNSHRLICFEKLFEGSINRADVYPREIVRRALSCNAAAVILVHNHPSGVSDPSEADIELTLYLKHILESVDVRVLDHLIVGSVQTISFGEQGILI